MQVAIEHALNVLTWYENLPKDEVPPEHLWEDGEGLEQWWASVEAKRDDGGVATSRGRVDSDDGDGDQPSGMAENDYARFLKQS